MITQNTVGAFDPNLKLFAEYGVRFLRLDVYPYPIYEQKQSPNGIVWQIVGYQNSFDTSFVPNLDADLDSKQDLLISGTNIKTINSQSLLGAGDLVISTSVAWGGITGTLSNQTDLQTALDTKVDENAAIVGATKTKITYDTKGLITSGADATTADINDSTDRRYVTDANLVVINNTSGTNTGDQTSIVGITGTKAQFDTACTDGNFLYVGDVTQYTDEQAQDAVGNILVDSSNIDFTYDDGVPSITADLTVTGVTAGTYGGATVSARIGVDDKGRIIGASDVTITPAFSSITGTPTTLAGYGITDAQPLDADLTSWAGVTRAAGFDTFAATPTSANLRSLVTDESGTGVLLFANGAIGTPVSGTLTNCTGLPEGGLSLTDITTNNASTTAHGFFPKLTSNSVYYVDNAGALTALALGAASTVLQSNGATSAPTFAAVSASLITVADEATDITCFPLFATAATGSLGAKSNANLTYNSFTGRLTSTITVGTTVIAVSGCRPDSTDSSALGSTGFQWADLFLATGGVINFNNGNATITHSAALLTSNVDVAVPDEAYGSGWNASLEVPTKNAVYDKVEAMIAAYTSTSGVGVSPTATQTDTVTHNLGRTPITIRIYGMSQFTSNAAATPTPGSIGLYSSSGNTCIYQAYNTAAITTTQNAATSTAFAVNIQTGANSFVTGVIQNVTSTTFDIAWTETGTAVAKVYMWEAW